MCRADNTQRRPVWRAGSAIGAAVLGSVLALSSASAQHVVISPKDSAEAVAAAAEADTGRMVWPYQDLSAYKTPGMCLAAIRRFDRSLNRRNDRIMTEPGTAGDTLKAASVALGRRCSAQLPSVADMWPLDLPNMITLAIVLHDTATMHAAIARRMQIETTPETKGYVLLDVINMLLQTKASLPPWVNIPLPRNSAEAQPFVEQLDALGSPAARPRVEAHLMRWWVASSDQFDTTAILREDRALRLLRPQLLRRDREDRSLSYNLPIFLDSTAVGWYRHEPNLPAYLQRATTHNLVGLGSDSAEFAAGYRVHLGIYLPLAKLVGTKAPPFSSQFRFPADASTMAPTPGHVTLVWDRELKGGGYMDGITAELLRLYNRYHDQGLDIVLVFRTAGYSWSSPPQSPADEAKSIAWYYSDYLNVPFKIVVYETPYTHDEFGRRQEQHTAFFQEYPGGSTIIGRDGRVYTTGGMGLESESQLNAYIAQALAAK